MRRFDASLKIWRAVEAQHVVSTLRLTGNDPEAQDQLEQILEESKPALPADAVRLHYLLAAPFRYPPRAGGSRFRRWTDPGVLYGAEHRRTACAEMGYWRWRFVQDSDGLREIPAAPQTLFQAGVKGPAVDVRDREWSDPNDYTEPQRIGQEAREQGAGVILYRSVRDPERGTCAAVLDPLVLTPRRPLAQETWHLAITQSGVLWMRERQRFVFRFAL